MRRALAVLLICVIAVSTTSAQQSPATANTQQEPAQQTPLPAKASELRTQITALQPLTQITVFPARGAKKYGILVSSDQTTFTFHDIDGKSDLTYQYVDVKTVKEGYEGYKPKVQHHYGAIAFMVIGTVAFVVVGLVMYAKFKDKQQQMLNNMPTMPVLP